MKRVVLFLVVALVIALVWWMSRDGRRSPDERIADHTREMCKIAKAGIEAPDDGVRRLFRYYGDKGPAMAKDWAELLVLIERIEDDRAHDERAKVAARRIHTPAARCAQTFQRFADAVERNPAAKERLERGVERFSRTIEILFGGKRGALVPAPLAPAWPLGQLLANPADRR